MLKKERLSKIAAYTLILLVGGLLGYELLISKGKREGPKGIEEREQPGQREKTSTIQKEIPTKEKEVLESIQIIYDGEKDSEVCCGEDKVREEVQLRKEGEQEGNIKLAHEKKRVKDYLFLKLTDKNKRALEITDLKEGASIIKEKGLGDILPSYKNFILTKIKNAANEILEIAKDMAAWIPVTIVAFVSNKIADFKGKQKKTLKKDDDLPKEERKDTPKDDKPSLRLTILRPMMGCERIEYLELGEQIIRRREGGQSSLEEARGDDQSGVEDIAEKAYSAIVQQNLILFEQEQQIKETQLSLEEEVPSAIRSERTEYLGLEEQTIQREEQKPRSDLEGMRRDTQIVTKKELAGAQKKELYSEKKTFGATQVKVRKYSDIGKGGRKIDLKKQPTKYATGMLNRIKKEREGILQEDKKIDLKQPMKYGTKLSNKIEGERIKPSLEEKKKLQEKVKASIPKLIVIEKKVKDSLKEKEEKKEEIKKEKSFTFRKLSGSDRLSILTKGDKESKGLKK